MKNPLTGYFLGGRSLTGQLLPAPLLLLPTSSRGQIVGIEWLLFSFRDGFNHGRMK